MSQDLAVTQDRDRTLELATFFSSLTSEELPSGVAHHAKLLILNSIGCGLSGAVLESHRKMMSVLNITSKQPLGDLFNVAAILGRPERAPIGDAAMLNGLAMTARFFDDTHLSTVVHPSGPPLAALLACAEAQSCSGKELLLAFVVGVEAMLAVATALGLEPYKRGWHTTSITGTFGATAAVAKLMSLSPIQFAHALGHASSMTAGTRGVFGTDSLSMHAGRAAQNGLLAAKMAAEGLGSTTHALEKWIKLVRHDGGDAMADAVLANASSAHDRNWMILETAFKPYPCGIVIHPAIDAGLEAHKYFFNHPDTTVPEDSPQDPLNIFSYVEARVTPLTIKLCGVRNPENETPTVFSTYHGIAISLIYGKAGIHQFAMHVVKEPLVKALRNRIRLVADDTLQDDQALLIIRYRDGMDIEVERHFKIEHATGSMLNSMTEFQVVEKFMSQARLGGVDEEAAKQAIRYLMNLESLPGIGSIMGYLIPLPNA